MRDALAVPRDPAFLEEFDDRQLERLREDEQRRGAESADDDREPSRWPAPVAFASAARLSVSRVRPNEGWRASVDRDDDEIEADFRRGGREVELEAEIDDGRLEVEVCRKGS